MTKPGAYSDVQEAYREEIADKSGYPSERRGFNPRGAYVTLPSPNPGAGRYGEEDA